MSSGLFDQHGRRKRKLRISITDRCNFRCPYCMPQKPRWRPARELLSAAQYLQLASHFVRDGGISQIRLTGGEPLLRRELLSIVQGLQSLRDSGLHRLSLSSNGVRLAALAADLVAAGLDDANISLDSLDPAQFARLSRGRYGLADVLTGIESARRAGLPLKLNSVIIRGYNDDQILPLARWAGEHGLELRFIEFMPLDDEALWSRDRVVSAADIRRTLEQDAPLLGLPSDGSPARHYQLPSGQRIGIIATVTEPFCGDCDRLRITADGRLFSCLFGTEGTALLPHLDDPERLAQTIRDAVWRKPAGYVTAPGYATREVRMYQLGG